MNRRDQARLYYLYMSSDGEVSANEKKLFTSICKGLCVDTDDRNVIIKECKKENLSCIEILKKNAEGEYSYGGFNLDLGRGVSNNDKAVIMWNLINLGYADTYYTNEEREIVDFLRKYWKIDDSLYCEMIDVAETILSLEKQKKWVEEVMPESELKKEKLKKIKTNIKFVQETIKTTLSEIDC